jgi:hypothetical protein
MFNPFIKLGGFELFGTFEVAQGNSAIENGEIQYASDAGDSTLFNSLKDRQFTQIEADLIYRFGSREQFYAGIKYNNVTGTQAFGLSTTSTAGDMSQGIRKDISIDRAAVGAGWFITRNILVKGEYVSQMYKHFPEGNILEGGKFNGFVLQGSIAF